MLIILTLKGLLQYLNQLVNIFKFPFKFLMLYISIDIILINKTKALCGPYLLRV